MDIRDIPEIYSLVASVVDRTDKIISEKLTHMKKLKFWGIFVICLSVSSCASLLFPPIDPKPPTSKLKPPTTIKHGNLENYKYVYITPTNILSSSSGYTISGQYYTTSKSVNPSDVIAGILTKEGFIRLPELKPELTDETVIVNYGESGKRTTGFGGYAIEVTIQLISAKSSTLICSCTAEGQGATEADDIRQAVTRCLTELMAKGN